MYFPTILQSSLSKQLEDCVLTMGEQITNSQPNPPLSADQARIAALSRLSGNLAHDFNNLFTAIIGQTSLALAFVPPESQAYRSIKNALVTTEKAIALAEMMQLFSGKGHIEQFTLDLNETLNALYPALLAHLPETVELRMAVDPTLPLLSGDRSYLERLLTALVINSGEAVLPGGKITITTAVYEVTGADDPFGHYVGALLPGRYIQLTLADDGIGMTPATRAHLFEPFYTTKGSGRGLGLATVLGIVRGHKGGIQVNSTPGQGCTVSILLPTQALTQQTLPHPPVADIRPVRQNKKPIVLAIDDDPFIRAAISDILGETDIRVMSAPNGASGLALYKQFSGEIDLILLDVNLPDIGGQAIFEQLQMLNQAVRVIITSGDATTPPALAHLPAINKPYRADDLIRCIQSALV